MILKKELLLCISLGEVIRYFPHNLKTIHKTIHKWNTFKTVTNIPKNIFHENLVTLYNPTRK